MKSFCNNKILNENNQQNTILPIKNKKYSIKSNNNSWTIQEDKLLLQLVCGNEKKINWDLISKKFPGRNLNANIGIKKILILIQLTQIQMNYLLLLLVKKMEKYLAVKKK